MAKADIVIRGKTFSIACAPGQEHRLVTLSRELDARVEGIAGAVGDIGDQRLLLIAALSLLDELSAAQHSIETVSGPDVDRASRALETASERILALAGRIETEL